MVAVLGQFFAMYVPTAGPDAYPGTPPWVVALVWVAIPLLICGLVLKMRLETVHRRNLGQHDEDFFEEGSGI